MFKKAERKKIKLKVGITGPSGSGKTFSALRLARGIVGKNGKIAVGDTENGSASLYSDKHQFDVVEIKPPYTVDKFLDVINSAVASGYDALILDSISHQWKGEGGILNKKEQMDARGGNSFTNWGKLTPEQERFLSGILHSDIHIISTIRSKQDYQMVTGEGNKQKVQKVGLAPIQREGMEYEFTTVFDVAMNHEAETSKDRTGIFTDRVFQITEKTGEEMNAWLTSGAAQEPTEKPAAPPPKFDENEKIDPTNAIQGAKTESETVDHGEFVNKFGTKHAGKKISAFTKAELDYLIPWLKAEQAAGKHKTKEANDLLFHAEAYEGMRK